MIQTISIEEYLQHTPQLPILDVRSPKEFAKGHIPGAFSLPLFSDEERVIIGTTYKQEGREPAILKGFELTGSKWSGFIKKAEAWSPDKNVAIHCWRGGMRSAAMAWALDFYGFKVSVINGGYKSFRRWVLNQFAKDYRLLILGGMTGSHKTEILKEIRSEGNQVIDMEGLAQHQGSAFGSMNKMTQPTQEQFENELSTELSKLDATKTIWMEDESQAVGKVLIPGDLWSQMESARLIALKIPDEERISFLTRTYGSLDTGFLIHATEKIKRRLGSQRTQQAIDAIKENRMRDFVTLVLHYYDKTYRHWMDKRPRKLIIPLTITNYESVTACSHKLLKTIKL